jgi:membrane protein required for colicin V production
LNWVDAFIVGSILWFTYSAFHAGMIREVVTILGAIFGVALAGLLYTNLAEDVGVVIDSEETALIVSFAIIFAAVILASQLTAMFLKQTAHLLMLGIFDSMGGAVIGFIKGVILVEIALIVAITFGSLHLVDDVDGSAFAPLFIEFLPFLKHILPSEFKTAIDEFNELSTIVTQLWERSL